MEKVDKNLPKDFEELCRESRLKILENSFKSKTSHIGSSLSVVEILLASFLHLNEFRDSIIFSKGHAANGLYSVLSVLNKIDQDISNIYCKDGSEYYGHANHKVNKLIPLSTGSLGHGLPFGVGVAMSKKIQSMNSSRILVIISDGECDEGTTWESALIANHFQLDNLIVIVDRNGLQSLTTTEDTIKLEPFKDKWVSFGWDCVEIDGHNGQEIVENLINNGKPKCIIANTVKGKGIPFMEDKVEWHYKYPNDEEFEIAKKLLK